MAFFVVVEEIHPEDAGSVLSGHLGGKSPSLGRLCPLCDTDLLETS